MGNDGFMSNEKLYTMIENLNNKITELFVEVRKNNHIKDEVEKNNNNIEKLTNQINCTTHEVNKLLDHREMKDNFKEKFFRYVGWAVGAVSTALTVIVTIKGL